MDRSRFSDYRMLSEQERRNAIKSYCRQKLPLTKTAARIKAQKDAKSEASVTPMRAVNRCRSPPEPLRDTRARQSTCPTCVAFAEREAMRTNTGRAQRGRGRDRKAGGATRTSKVSVHSQPGVLSHISGAHPVPSEMVDPCEERRYKQKALRDKERMPARGVLRWQLPKCLAPQILDTTISDVPWGGTPGARLLPERAPHIVPRHPLEKRAKSSPEYWRKQFDKLENQVRGPTQAVEDMWDALTPNVLHRIAPILDIPMPTARQIRDDYSFVSEEGVVSEDKSADQPFWETVSLPEEIPEMNISPSESAFKDWQYATSPDVRPTGYRSFGMLRNERTSLQMAVLAPERLSLPRSDRLMNQGSKESPNRSGRLSPKVSPKPAQKLDSMVTYTRMETAKTKDTSKGVVIEITRKVTEKTSRFMRSDALGEEKELYVEEPLEARRYVKVHDHFEQIGRDANDEYRIYLSKGAKPKDKEHEGEFLSPEYQMMRMIAARKGSTDSWEIDKYFNASYLDERRRLVGSEQLNKEMMDFLNLLNVDLEVHPPTLYPRDEGLFSIPGRPNNPYYNFLRKPRRKAAIWREHFKPETTGEAMDAGVLLHPDLNLPEKAHHISSKITSEFMDWVRGLGGVRPSELNEELIQQLFDVTFDMPAAKSLCVRVRELPVVTKQVADACFARDGEEQEGLRRELHADLAAEKRRRHLVAFGKFLERCCPQRFMAPHNKVRRTWIECHVPEDLTSSRFVFEGITHLVSVQRFCEWLDRHPNQEPPAYLRTVGMVGPEAIRYRARGGQSTHQRSRFEDQARRTSFYTPSRRDTSRPTLGHRSSPAKSGRRTTQFLDGTSTRMTARESETARKLERLHQSLTRAREMAVL